MGYIFWRFLNPLAAATFDKYPAITQGGFFMATDYKRYLASREWALRREAVKKRAGSVCERCDTLPLRDVHHLTYANIGNEPLDDLQGICGPCHEYESGVEGAVDPKDVCDWVFNADFWHGEQDDHWGEGWKQHSEDRWATKYDTGWEVAFIRFTLAWPAVFTRMYG